MQSSQKEKTCVQTQIFTRQYKNSLREKRLVPDWLWIASFLYTVQGPKGSKVGWLGGGDKGNLGCGMGFPW